MILKLLSTCFCAVLSVAAFSAFVHAAEVKDCVGKPADFLAPMMIKPCLSVAERKAVKPRQKSIIYLQAAESTYFTSQKDKKAAGKLFEAALKADTTFVDAHMALAFFRYLTGLPTDAIATLEAGLKEIPDDPVLNAAHASLIATQQNGAAIEKSCDASMAHARADRRIVQLCAEALRSSGLKEKALQAYHRAAFDFDQSEVIDYGVTHQIDIGEEYASLLAEAGRKNEAAEAYGKYLNKHSILGVQYSKVAHLAYLQEEAGLRKNAAETYRQAARLAPVEARFDLRFKQMIALVSTGRWLDAKTVSDEIFLKASKREVLQLQVRLKTGTQSTVKITGRFDESTQSALAECLKDTGCFTKIKGDAL